MTDKAPETSTAETPSATKTATDEQAGPITANKTFWAGVGIGSAALVAALMYARSPKRKK